MEFKELADLQRFIRSLEVFQVVSLINYHIKESRGFRHLYGGPPTGSGFSKASTATCVLSLVNTGYWTNDEPWFSETVTLGREMLLEKWTSADLPLNNPFTVSFILEAVLALSEIDHTIFAEPQYAAKKQSAIDILNKSLKKKPNKNDKYAVIGAANIRGYPPNTYLTQLVVRVLIKCNSLEPKIRVAVRKWAWHQIEHELALIFSGSKSADAYSLAYAVLLFMTSGESHEATPDENQILHKAIDAIFEAQLPDGSWPRSRTLFHYPRVGNAYCYEYEMLAQFLKEKELLEHSLRHLPEISRATKHLRDIGFQFENGGMGWASGHHPQLAGPESWSTASVYQFLYELDRVLTEAIRRSIFDYVGSEYRREQSKKSFAPRFWDSEITVNGNPLSLRQVIFKQFVEPIAKHTKDVENGRELPKYVPMSAVFFGPPGTSKTQLAKEIAAYIGWPLLIIDPSHLVRKGMDQVQAETNLLFSMLASAERIVVLLDEFDEMVRERTAAQSEALSRFLTTAMLPKLTLINDRRRIVFIVATNHINQFDFAIRRPGRFDLIIQIMPPGINAKLQAIPDLVIKLKNKYQFDIEEEIVKKQLSVLTYAEFIELSNALNHIINREQAQNLIKLAYERCTLRQKITNHPPDQTWEDICNTQKIHVRIPGL